MSIKKITQIFERKTNEKKTVKKDPFEYEENKMRSFMIFNNEYKNLFL